MMMQLLPILTELVNEGVTVGFRPAVDGHMGIRLYCACGSNLCEVEEVVHLQSAAAMRFDFLYETLRNLQARLALACRRSSRGRRPR